MLRLIYQASNNVDAHMVLNMLESHGLTGQIEGEYLQGGVGELQATGLVKVMIADHDYEKAREVLQEWERAQISSKIDQANHKINKNLVWLLILAFVLSSLCLFVLSGL